MRRIKIKERLIEPDELEAAGRLRKVSGNCGRIS